MRTYKLQKADSSSRRRSEVREKRLEWNAPAIIVCILLAIAVWLYMVSILPPIEAELYPTETKPSVGETTPSEPSPASAAGAPLAEDGCV